MVSVMKIQMAPLESRPDIGTLDAQIQEIKEAVELPELYEDTGFFRPPKGRESRCMGTGKPLLAKFEVERQMLSIAFCFLRAKAPEERAYIDLETHYTKEYLDEKFESCRRRAMLYKEDA